MTLREEILAANDLRIEQVEVPEWDKTINVTMMTGLERDQYEAELMEKKDLPLPVRMQGLRAKLIAVCVVDDDGAKVFTMDDLEAIGGKNSAALDRIVAVASRLNALTGEDIDQLAGN